MFSLAVQSMQGSHQNPNEERRRSSYGLQGNNGLQDVPEGFDSTSRRRSTQVQQQLMQQKHPRPTHSSTVSHLFNLYYFPTIATAPPAKHICNYD